MENPLEVWPEGDYSWWIGFSFRYTVFGGALRDLNGPEED